MVQNGDFKSLGYVYFSSCQATLCTDTQASFKCPYICTAQHGKILTYALGGAEVC